MKSTMQIVLVSYLESIDYKGGLKEAARAVFIALFACVLPFLGSVVAL